MNNHVDANMDAGMNVSAGVGTDTTTVPYLRCRRRRTSARSPWSYAYAALSPNQTQGVWLESRPAGRI